MDARVHDVAVLDAVGAEPRRGLDRVRAGRVGHHAKSPLTADREGGLELVVQQERLGVSIPRGPHDAAGQVQLDVIDPVLDLLADGADEAVGAVAFARVAGGEEVPAGRGEEVAGREHPRARVLTRLEGPLPRDVHEVRRARAPHADHPALGERLHQAMAEDGGLLGDGGAGRRQVVGVDVDVPQAGQEIGALEIDDPRVARVGRPARAQHFHDAPAVDGDAGAREGPRTEAVDHRRVREHGSHRADPARGAGTGQTGLRGPLTAAEKLAMVR